MIQCRRALLYNFCISSPFEDYIFQAQRIKNHACRSHHCQFCFSSLGTFSNRTKVLSSILARQLFAVLLWRPLFIIFRPPYGPDW